MASSSSAKKVARVAASSRNQKTSKRAAWLFPASIAAIVVIGVAIVAFARNENAGLGENDTPPRAQLEAGQPADHWHAAFSVNVCGEEMAALTDGVEDPLGIHTHDDGLIHIHPFSVRAAGERATMKRFFDQVGIEVTDDGFKLQDGKVYKEGETSCGGEPGEARLAYWKDARTASSSEPDEIIDGDFSGVRFTEDGAAYTLAFVPEGSTDIPAPAAAAQIEELGAIDGGSSGASTVDPDAGGVTIPPEIETETPGGSTPEGSTPEGSTPEGSGSTPAGSDPAAGSEPAAGTDG